MPRILDEWLGYCKKNEMERKTGKVKRHNKWWAGCILQDDDGSYRVHTLYAGLGQKGSEHIERFDKGGNPLSPQGARSIFDELVKDKEKKGYEEKQFGAPFGLPTPATIASFRERFSLQSSNASAAALAPRGSAVSSTVPGVAVTCTHCGTVSPLQEEFCLNCGMELSTSVAPNTSSAQSAVAKNASSRVSPPVLIGPLPDGYQLRGRYAIVTKVGEGGMGAVYKAEDRDFANRLVAVKELVPDQRLSHEQLVEANEAFKQEAMLLAPLTHQCLPRIYDHFIEADRSYLVMDFIGGETLEHSLEHAPENRLPVEQVLTIGIALCDVLDYLHTRQPPIIFRDLKPGNVMLSERGHVYLIDFGIARVFKFGQQKDTTALGSPGYAAPEQYGKSQSTPKTDLYALGATLHHALTGCDPSESPFQFDPFPPSAESVPELETLVMGMVRFKADDRQPADVAQVKKTLAELLASRVASTTPPNAATSQVRKRSARTNAKKLSGGF